MLQEGKTNLLFYNKSDGIHTRLYSSLRYNPLLNNSLIEEESDNLKHASTAVGLLQHVSIR